ncbi:MAG TPA: site-specific integrase [Acidimicrobiia bacterium]
MGHIQKIDRPEPWRARFRAPVGRERSRSFRRKVDAERWLRDEESKADRGLWLDPDAGKVSLADYAESWLAGRQLKPKSVATYKSLLDSRILPKFGDWQLRQITPDAVRAWVAGMVEEGLSPSRVGAAREVLASILNQAVEDGVLGRNAAAKVKTPTKKPRRQRFLTPDQVAKLAAACERRQQGAGAFETFLAWSGLRWGEAIALKASDVDLDRRRVKVHRAISEVNGELIERAPKTHEHRTVIVPRHALPPFPNGKPDEPKTSNACDVLVFTAPRGGPLRSAHFRSRVWLPAVAETGLGDLVPHELRDTAASLAISSGASVKAVQRMLGHKAAAMTLDVYGGLYDDDLEDLADRLEELHDAYDAADLPRHRGGTG